MALYDELMAGTVIYSRADDGEEVIRRVAPTSLALRAAREMAARAYRISVLEELLAGTISPVEEVEDFNPNQIKLF